MLQLPVVLSVLDTLKTAGYYIVSNTLYTVFEI